MNPMLYIPVCWCVGPCTAVNSPVDLRFVNSFPPCIADADGYLISNSVKGKGKLDFFELPDFQSWYIAFKRKYSYLQLYLLDPFFVLGTTSVKEGEDNETIKEENLYDHLEFNGPVKKLEPHYHSSKTLKSLASMDKEIEL